MSEKIGKVVVYRARNLVNGDSYIGVTKRGLAKREQEHRYDAKRGVGNLLHKALRKYGGDSLVFEAIMDFAGDYELAMAFEAEIVAKERPKYNLVPGGRNRVGPYSAETTSKMRESHLGKVSPRKGRKAPPETVAKLRARKITAEWLANIRAAAKIRSAGRPGPMTGKTHTAEAVAKMRAAKLGKPGPWKGKNRPGLGEKLSAALKGRTAHNKGVPMREESKAKLSVALKGCAPPPESELMRTTRAANMRKAAAARKVRIICVNDGSSYLGAGAVLAVYPISESSLFRVLKKVQPSVKGLHFTYEVSPSL